MCIKLIWINILRFYMFYMATNFSYIYFTIWTISILFII